MRPSKWWLLFTVIAMLVAGGIVTAIPGQQIGLAIGLGLLGGTIAGFAAAWMDERYP